MHTRLDEIIGPIDSLAAYRVFLIRSYRFRTAVEPALAGRPEWAVQELTRFIGRDLDDLGEGDVPEVAWLSIPAGFASVLGGLYVLEGSALGARILFSRAQRLGLSESFGARHLAAQSGDPTRWKRFANLLGRSQLDQSTALDSARIVFELALSIYSEPVGETA